jgi:hypothetical protein
MPWGFFRVFRLIGVQTGTHLAINVMMLGGTAVAMAKLVVSPPSIVENILRRLKLSTCGSAQAACSPADRVRHREFFLRPADGDPFWTVGNMGRPKFVQKFWHGERLVAHDPCASLWLQHANRVRSKVALFALDRDRF